MKVLIKSMLATVAVLGLAACSSNDLYDEAQVSAQKMAAQKSKYDTNFENAFGKVASTQSWDFSTAESRLGTRGYSNVTTKFVEGLNFNCTYTVKIEQKDLLGKPTKCSLTPAINSNKAIYDNVIKQLPDGKKHKDVKKATLVAPSSSFTIYPISVQGGWKHELFVKVGDADPVKVYSKTWTDFSRPFVNGDALKANYTVSGNFITGYNVTYTIKDKASLPGLYVEAPVGTPIEIYLDNVKANETRKPSVGTSTGNAIYVDGKGAKPEGVELRDDADIKYVGIEDQLGGGDFDYNDVVLAIVGNPDVPEEIIIENDEYDVPTSVTKRYMIEDLGSTDDFDFNDIVVDVTETTVAHHKVVIENGIKVSDVITGTDKSQKAVIRHLGGTLPFQLTIGDTKLDEMQGVLGSDPNTEFTVSGWVPARNNVSVKVKAKDSNMYNEMNFPKTGAIPMIFACNDNVEWAAERQRFNFSQFPGYKTAE